MPDENSTPIGTNQTSQDDHSTKTQSGNDFVLDFGDGESMEETKDSGEKSGDFFDINVENEKEKNSNETDFNQDDLFVESPKKDDEDLDFGNTFTDIEKNDEENKEENDFFVDMNSNSESDANQERDNTETIEENNDLFGDTESSISDTNAEENLELGKDELNTENTQDELTGEIKDENDQLELQQIEEDSLNIQENKIDENSDFSINMDEDNPINSEENDNMQITENMEENVGNSLSLETQAEDYLTEGKTDSEQKIQNEQGEKAENNIDFSSESNDSDEVRLENNTDEHDVNSNKLEELFVSGGDVVNDVANDSEGKTDSEQEIQNEQGEKAENNIDFSFESNDSDEVKLENNIDEHDVNSNKLEELFTTDGSDIVGTTDGNSEKSEDGDNINIDSVINNQNNLNKEENQTDKLNGEGNELFQDSNTQDVNESVDNNLFGDDVISQNNEITENVNVEDNGEFVQNQENTEIKNEEHFNQNVAQYDSSGGNNQQNGEVLENRDNESLGEVDVSGNKKDNIVENNQSQELFTTEDTTEKEKQGNSQPDMMNLLGGQPVDFSYEENATTLQQTENSSENTIENVQDYVENHQEEQVTALQNPQNTPLNDNNLSDNASIPEKSDLNVISNEENIEISNVSQNTNTGNIQQDMQNTVYNINPDVNIGNNTQNENIVQVPEANKINESITLNQSNNIPQVSENVVNQAEAIQIKSTLSLDEILDSELQTNPQFADNSKAVPKNITIKTSSGSKKLVSIFAGVGLFILVGLVAVLAFPSVSTERKSGDVVEDTGIEAENTEVSKEYIPEDIEDSYEDNAETLDDLDGGDTENVTTNHGVSSKVEFPEDTVDEDNYEKDDEDTDANEEVKPYRFTEDDEDTDVNEEIMDDNSLINDIQSKISSFKMQAEGYKETAENESNEKVIKYATYIIRLCEEYQSQVDEGQGIDEESLSSFETKVNEFVSKIKNHLELPEDVETVYSK